jgi:hypothetical protein
MRDDFTTGKEVTGCITIKGGSKVSQSSRIPLTLKQRIFLTGLFLLAFMLSYFAVSTIDPLASKLPLSLANGSRTVKIIDPGSS